MPDNPFESLTPKQRQVAGAIAIGWERAEIAENLGFTPKTFDTHRASALARLGVRNSVELARLAIAWGEVETPCSRHLVVNKHGELVEVTP